MAGVSNLKSNRFYVYLHRSRLTGEVFYIGKGQTNRLYSTHNRSKAWILYTAQHGFVAEILVDNLTNEQAIIIESEYISNYPGKLLNVSKTSRVREYPQHVVNLFYYDETSPTCLRWKEDRVDKLGRVRKYKGKVAGCKSGRYYTVETGHMSYLIHRIVYCLHHQQVPTDLEVDHINRDSFDNRIVNLRGVSKSANNRNRSLPSKTGEQYVYHMLKKGREHYLVKIPKEGKRVEFRFFVEDYASRDCALTEAITCARAAKKEILNECS